MTINNNFLLVLFIFVIVLSSIPVLADNNDGIRTRIDSEIIDILKNQDSVFVIVVLKDDSNIKYNSQTIESERSILFQEKQKYFHQKQDDVLSTLSESEFKVKHRYSIVNGFSGNITKEGLRKLKGMKNVLNIHLNRKGTYFLDDTASLIGADKIWDQTIENINIKGQGQTVCVIDSGVDYTHPELGECSMGEFLNGNCEKVIGGYDYCSDTNCIFEDSDPMDVSTGGHGTHVAGIVAANGRLNGIAPETKIVALKSGVQEPDEDATYMAVEWCVNNATKYNISVISISSGFGWITEGSNCYPNELLSQAITEAYNQDIFVSISSGNDGRTDAISYPACVAGAVSVGATYDKNINYVEWKESGEVLCTDTDVSKDNITCFTNRNQDLDLLAPGVQINSTHNDWFGPCLEPLNNAGCDFIEQSGTSASAPHVAGSVALINQYLNLTERSASPDEIETALKETGKSVYDSNTSLYFPRIDVYKAIFSYFHVLEVGGSQIEDSVHGYVGQSENWTNNITVGSIDKLHIYLDWNDTNDLTLTLLDENDNVLNETSDPRNWEGLTYQEPAEGTYKVKVYGESITSVDQVEFDLTVEAIEQTDPGWDDDDIGGVNFSSANLDYISTCNPDHLEFVMVGEEGNGTVDIRNESQQAMNDFLVSLVIPNHLQFVSIDEHFKEDKIRLDPELEKTNAATVMLEADVNIKVEMWDYLHGGTTQDSFVYFMNDMYDDWFDLLEESPYYNDIYNANFNSYPYIGGRLWISADNVTVNGTGCKVYIEDANLQVQAEVWTTHIWSGKKISEYGFSQEIQDDLNDRLEQWGQLVDNEWKANEINATYYLNTDPKYSEIKRLYISFALAHWYKDQDRSQLVLGEIIDSYNTSWIEYSPVNKTKIVELDHSYDDASYTDYAHPWYGTTLTYKFLGGCVLSAVDINLTGNISNETQELLTQAIVESYAQEGNKHYSGAVMKQPYSDLIPKYLWFDTVVYAVDDVVNISLIIKNQGEQAAADFIIKFYDNFTNLNDYTTMYLIAQENITNISASVSKLVETQWTADEQGTHEIYIELDSNNDIKESNELNNKILKTITVINPYPTAIITSPVDGETFGEDETIQFDGYGTDLQDGTVSNLLWMSNINGTIGTNESFSKDDLTIGTYIINLTVTDSDGYKNTVEVGISIFAPEPPVANIISPINNQNFSELETIYFSGTGTDWEDGTLTGSSLVWTSDIDGQIGTGTLFTNSSLSVNTHVIILNVTDSDNTSDTKQVTIIVEEGNPNATIISPENNSYYTYTQYILFNGNATDPQEGLLANTSLSWESNIDGYLGSGVINISTLSEGIHTITLTAIDSFGLTDTEEITVTIEPSTPTASIILPRTGQSFVYGNNITFKGTGYDALDQDLTGSNLTWMSSINDTIGFGTEISNSSLGIENHTINLTAVNSRDKNITVEIDIEIESATPNIFIISPEDMNISDNETSIEFKGIVTDLEDVELTGASLNWYSNINGSLGTGNFSGTLIPGRHTITLNATDSDGKFNSTSITIDIIGPNEYVQTKFIDDSTEKIFTFEGNENQTFNISIPKNSTILEGKLNLTGLSYHSASKGGSSEKMLGSKPVDSNTEILSPDTDNKEIPQNGNNSDWEIKSVDCITFEEKETWNTLTTADICLNITNLADKNRKFNAGIDFHNKEIEMIEFGDFKYNTYTTYLPVYDTGYEETPLETTNNSYTCSDIGCNVINSTYCNCSYIYQVGNTTVETIKFEPHLFPSTQWEDLGESNYRLKELEIQKPSTGHNTKTIYIQVTRPPKTGYQSWKFDLYVEEDGVHTILDPWWNSNWGKRRNVTITNSDTIDHIDETIKIIFNHGGNADTTLNCSDIRITNPDGTELERTVQNTSIENNLIEIVCNSTHTEVMFNATVGSSTNKNYTIYYDNSGVGEPSYNIKYPFIYNETFESFSGLSDVSLTSTWFNITNISSIHTGQNPWTEQNFNTTINAIQLDIKNGTSLGTTKTIYTSNMYRINSTNLTLESNQTINISFTMHYISDTKQGIATFQDDTGWILTFLSNNTDAYALKMIDGYLNTITLCRLQSMNITDTSGFYTSRNPKNSTSHDAISGGGVLRNKYYNWDWRIELYNISTANYLTNFTVDAYLDKGSGYSKNLTLFVEDVAGYPNTGSIGINAYGLAAGGSVNASIMVDNLNITSANLYPKIYSYSVGSEQTSPYPENVYLIVGDSDYKIFEQTGEFNTENRTDDFSLNITNYLSTCSSDENQNCDVPFLLHSDTEGKIEVSDIFIKYLYTDKVAPNITNITLIPNPTEPSESISISVNATDNINISEVNVTLFGTLTYNETSMLYEGTTNAPAVPDTYEINVIAEDAIGLITEQLINLNVIATSPDLQVSSIVYSSGDLFINENVSINATINNYGSPTSNFKVTLLINGTPQQNNTISLSENSNTTTEFTWNASYGYQIINITADIDLDIGEQNETNNDLTTTITILDNIPPTIYSINITPETAFVNDLIRVEANVTDNAGIDYVTAFINETINLTYNSTTNWYDGNVTADETGTRTITVTAYDLDGLSSASSATIEVYGTNADLEIKPSDISYDQLIEGQNATFNITIYNNGKTDANDFEVNFIIDSIIQQNKTTSVSQESQTTIQFNWTAEYGAHNISADADINTEITESDESNNQATKGLFVFDTVPPVISDVYYVPAVIHENDQINISTIVSDNIEVDRVTADINGSSTDMTNVSGVYQGNITAGAEGDYMLIVTAYDWNNLTARRYIPITVYSNLAELIIDDVYFSSETPTDQELVSVIVDVTNQGVNDTGNFTINLKVNGSEKSTDVISIEGGETEQAYLNYTAEYGNITILIKADSNGDVNEIDENNNEYEINVTVVDVTGPPAPSPSANPSDWTTQKTHNISWDAVSDANGINRYEYQIDYGDWTSVGTDLSFTTPIQETGIHIVYVRAVDDPGNIGPSGLVSIYIDDVNPNTPVAREWHCGDNWTAHNSPYYTWTNPGDDGSGVTNYTTDFNGTTSKTNETYNETNLTTGVYEFKVKAEDALGQESDWSNIVTVYIDITLPDAPNVTSPTHPDQNQTYNNNKPVFELTESEDDSGISGYYYLIDDDNTTVPDEMGMWSRNSTVNVTGMFGGIQSNESANETGLPDGTWWFHVVAMDNVGNIGNNTTHFKFNVNYTPDPWDFNLDTAEEFDEGEKYNIYVKDNQIGLGIFDDFNGTELSSYWNQTNKSAGDAISVDGLGNITLERVSNITKMIWNQDPVSPGGKQTTRLLANVTATGISNVNALFSSISGVTDYITMDYSNGANSIYYQSRKAGTASTADFYDLTPLTDWQELTINWTDTDICIYNTTELIATYSNTTYIPIVPLRPYFQDPALSGREIKVDWIFVYAGYGTGNYTTKEIEIPNGEDLENLTIEYQNIGTYYNITKIEFLTNDTLMAENNTPIISGTSVTYTNQTLTSGDFGNLTGHFKARIYLEGDLSETVQITQIYGSIRTYEPPAPPPEPDFYIDSTEEFDAGSKSNSSGNYEIETYTDNLVISENTLELGNRYSDRFTFPASADLNTWKWTNKLWQGDTDYVKMNITDGKLKINSTCYGCGLDTQWITLDSAILAGAFDFQFDFEHELPGTTASGNYFNIGIMFSQADNFVWDSPYAGFLINHNYTSAKSFDAQDNYWWIWNEQGTTFTSGKMRINCSGSAVDSPIDFMYWNTTDWVIFDSIGRGWNGDTYAQILIDTIGGTLFHNATLDDFKINTGTLNNTPYRTSGNWISEDITIDSGKNLENTTINVTFADTYSNITKVEWLSGGILRAVNETDITTSGLVTYTDNTLDSGTFNDLNSTAPMTIRIYLQGNGTYTPTIDYLIGYYEG